jgi:glycine cleavage system H protein
MSTYPENFHYTKEHEWVSVDGGIATVGITDHAQRELGEIVFVELPNVGDRFEKGGEFGTVESVKAVSEVYSPVSGTVVEINDMVSNDPEKLNDDPHGEAWLVKIKLTAPEEIKQLLSAAEYQTYIADA